MKHIETMKLALEALEDFEDAIRYDNEQDDIGARVCCDVLSYNPHTKDCKAVKAITAIKQALAAPVPTVIGMRDAKYLDSTPRLHVGNSAFEDWFQAQPFATQTGTKQISRDSYAAGMGDPLVTYAAQPAPVQEPVAWMFEFPDKRVKPKFDSAPHGGNWQPLYTHPQPDAYGYAKRLAEAIWKKHYQSTAPQWEPFDDLMGVLTQIDNMTAGLTTPPAAQPATEDFSVAQTTPVQEPVAWMYQCSADNLGPVLMRHKQDWAKSGSGLWTEAPLYTSPQPAQRKPLTDEELRSIENEINPNMRWRSSDEEGITLYPSEYFELVRAIEAAHGIKENT